MIATAGTAVAYGFAVFVVRTTTGEGYVTRAYSDTSVEVFWRDPDEERRVAARERSADALAWACAHAELATPPELHARHGYADAPRRPCYRKPRTR